MIRVTQEIVFCYWRDEERVMVEFKNGAIERYDVNPSSWGSAEDRLEARAAHIGEVREV